MEGIGQRRNGVFRVSAVAGSCQGWREQGSRATQSRTIDADDRCPQRITVRIREKRLTGVRGTGWLDRHTLLRSAGRRVENGRGGPRDRKRQGCRAGVIGRLLPSALIEACRGRLTNSFAASAFAASATVLIVVAHFSKEAVWSLVTSQLLFAPKNRTPDPARRGLDQTGQCLHTLRPPPIIMGFPKFPPVACAAGAASSKDP